MKHIISGTNRPNSRSLQISKTIQSIYESMGEKVEIINLEEMPLNELTGAQYQDNKPQAIVEAVAKIEKSDGLIMVIPEYNGSYPGALKYFIDHWSFPDAFEYRAVCYVGLGWQWGGLRPVEHMQQVMGYRNAFNFPKRVFLQNIGTLFDEENQLKEETHSRLEAQAQGFSQFVEALKNQRIDANSLLEQKNNK